MLDNDFLIKGEMYQYNLGWLIEELLSFKQDLATAIDLKTIKYADPIQWDITTQYPANTVVVDPKSGTAYMSKVPVPAGVELNNTNYWVIVFNYQDIYNRIMDGVAFNDKDQDYATKDLLVNDLVWYAGDLYRVTRAIPIGSKYIPGTNLAKTTIESLLARYYGRDRTAQVSNDTVNVSGDYTLIAGDIAETSTNRTIKVTKDREIDVDGSDSVHIDGVSTVNVGGLRTEVYAADKAEKVTGSATEEYVGTHTENHGGKKIVNAEDIVLNPTEPLTYKVPTKLNEAFNSVPFKSSEGEYKVLTEGNVSMLRTKNELIESNVNSEQINRHYFSLTGYNRGQGICIIDDTYAVMCLVKKSGENGAQLMKINMKTGEELETLELPSNYHANGATYNPVSKTMLVTNNSGIAILDEVDVENMTYVKQITVKNCQNTFNGITFSYGLNKLIGRQADTYFVIDPVSYTVEKTVNVNMPTYITEGIKNKNTYNQDSVCYDKYVGTIISSPEVVVFFDLDTGDPVLLLNVGNKIQNSFPTGELESGDFIPGTSTLILMTDRELTGTCHITNILKVDPIHGVVGNTSLIDTDRDPNRSKSIYVSVNADNRGDGTQKKPFRYAQEAIDMANCVMGSSFDIVSLADGEYGAIKAYYLNSYCRLFPDTHANVITGVEVERCNIDFRNVTIKPGAFTKPIACNSSRVNFLGTTFVDETAFNTFAEFTKCLVTIYSLTNNATHSTTSIKLDEESILTSNVDISGENKKLLVSRGSVAFFPFRTVMATGITLENGMCYPSNTYLGITDSNLTPETSYTFDHDLYNMLHITTTLNGKYFNTLVRYGTGRTPITINDSYNDGTNEYNMYYNFEVNRATKTFVIKQCYGTVRNNTSGAITVYNSKNDNCWGSLSGVYGLQC